jgi:hypothetical protein
MPRETLLESFLVRVSAGEHGASVRLQDLRTGVAVEFETWVAAWSYVDERLERRRSDDPREEGEAME